jgi:hypothetical protein
MKPDLTYDRRELGEHVTDRLQNGLISTNRVDRSDRVLSSKHNRR